MPYKPNVAAERARLFFGKPRFQAKKPKHFPRQMPRKMDDRKIPNLKKWKIREKEGKPNVAKHVTGAYFGLSKYASCLSQVFLYQRLKNTPHWIRTSNLRFRSLEQKTPSLIFYPFVLYEFAANMPAYFRFLTVENQGKRGKI